MSQDTPRRNPPSSIHEKATLDYDSSADAEFSVSSRVVRPGESFGRYTIERVLGEGAMGAVFLAQDTQLSRQVALKIPKFGGKVEPKQVERFYREARSAAVLSHPNICPVFDVGEIEGTHYIAMAFIAGQPLCDYISPDKPSPPRSSAIIVRKIALAMQEAHDQSIVHRDIKPANIMIDRRKEPVVMDFGLALQPHSIEESRLTQQGSIMGSPAYMAPEQLAGNLDLIGPRSDVYSLGVVLFELLTGQLPFGGQGSVLTLIGEILSKDPPNPSELRQEVSNQLAGICLRAIAKRPEDRYQSMREFADALAQFLKPASEGAPSPHATTVVDLELAKLNEQTRLVKTLCEEGQHAAAVTILEKLAGSQDAAASKHVAWAKTQLPKVKAMVKKPSAANDGPDWLDAPLNAGPSAPMAPASTLPSYMNAPAAKGRKRKISPLVWALPLGGVAAVLIAVGGYFVFASLTNPENVVSTGSADSEATASKSTPQESKSTPVAVMTPEVASVPPAAPNPTRPAAPPEPPTPPGPQFRPGPQGGNNPGGIGPDGPLRERQQPNGPPGGFGPGRAPRFPPPPEFLKHDQNRDGLLSRNELPEFMHRFIDEADRNNDGMLDVPEIQQGMRARQ